MKLFAVTTGLVLCFLGMFEAAAVNAAVRIPVFVSIVPQQYFVERIGGALVDVSVMVLPGASPATYEPKPAQMVALSKAKIYFAVGVPFEKVWLKKLAAANRKMLVVHTEKGIDKRLMRAHRPHKRGEHELKENPHRGIRDPHIWTSPMHVMIQARNILTALVVVDPPHRAVYEANYKRFIMELVDLDAEIRGILADKGKTIRFMVFHPAWGYFADAYGLEQIPIEIEGKEPKPAQLELLIDEAIKRGVKVIFVQPQFSVKSAKIIAKAIDGEIVFANPLAYDWVKNLREQARKFKRALR